VLHCAKNKTIDHIWLPGSVLPVATLTDGYNDYRYNNNRYTDNGRHLGHYKNGKRY